MKYYCLLNFLTVCYVYLLRSHIITYVPCFKLKCLLLLLFVNRVSVIHPFIQLKMVKRFFFKCSNLGTYFIEEVSVKRIEYHFQLSVVRKCILYKIYFYVHIIIAFNNFLCSFIVFANR